MSVDPLIVTVVIPVFHAGAWIRDCLHSVAEQNYDSWQAVIVEDGSKDATENIVSEFAQAVPGKFTYIHSPTNIGPAAARNLGIRRSVSEFVAFIDVDDLWTCDHLTTLVDSAVASGSDLVFARIMEFTAGLIPVLAPTEARCAPREVAAMDLFQNSPLLPSCILVRRKALVEIGMFNESLRWSEDLDLWIRLMRSGAKFHDSRRPSCWRRLSDSSLTSNSAKVAEHTGRLYLRHMEWPALDRRLIRQNASDHLTSAARMIFRSNPKQSSNLYYLSWRARPLRVTNLFLSLLALLAMVIPQSLRSLIRRYPQRISATGEKSHHGTRSVS